MLKSGVLVLAALALTNATWDETTPLIEGPALDTLLLESKQWAGASAHERSGEGTQIQRSLKSYAGVFLNSLGDLSSDTMSMAALTETFSEYLDQPRKLTGELAGIRDKVPLQERNVYEALAGSLDTNRLAKHILDKLPHDGDKLLMNDHSSCGEQSIDDIFADIYEEHARPEREFAAEQPAAQL